MQEVPHRIYAEQDDKGSRLLIQIGNDKPITLLAYDQLFLSNFGEVAVTELRSTDPELIGPSYVGISITRTPPNKLIEAK